MENIELGDPYTSIELPEVVGKDKFQSIGGEKIFEGGKIPPRDIRTRSIRRGLIPLDKETDGILDHSPR